MSEVAALLARADAHESAGQLAEALDAVALALASSPSNPALLTRLGLLQRSLGDLDDARMSFEGALAFAPDSDIAQLNLALVLDELGHGVRATALLERAHLLIETSPQARWMAALPPLFAGDYALGFERFEARLEAGVAGLALRDHLAPRWRGQPGTGTLLLWHEQGLGDSVQFLRFAARAKTLGWRVEIDAPNALLPIAVRASGVDASWGRGTCDAQLPLMSLPHALGVDQAGIGMTGPYLSAPPERAAKWRTLLPPSDRLRVGLAWRSTIVRGDVLVVADKLSKSLPLASLKPLARRGVDLVSLQVGAGAEEVGTVPGLKLIDLTAHIDDLADTAALIGQLDLVVSIDTVVAHLAGALGHPLLVLLSDRPDWRWMRGRSDSPWYPSATLLRQAARNDWRSPVAAAAEAVRAMAVGRAKGGILSRWIKREVRHGAV